MHYYDRTDTYIHGYGCNDGPESSEEDGKPTQEQIDLAMSRKWRQLLGNNLAAQIFQKKSLTLSWRPDAGLSGLPNFRTVG